MKKIGITVLAIGLLITLFTGFYFVTRENVMDVGKLQITVDNNHGVTWSPLWGFAVMVIGGAIYQFGHKKQ